MDGAGTNNNICYMLWHMPSTQSEHSLRQAENFEKEMAGNLEWQNKRNCWRLVPRTKCLGTLVALQEAVISGEMLSERSVCRNKPHISDHWRDLDLFWYVKFHMEQHVVNRSSSYCEQSGCGFSYDRDSWQKQSASFCFEWKGVSRFWNIPFSINDSECWPAVF